MRRVDSVGRFWFDSSCSPEEIKALKPVFRKHEKILPPWIDCIHVESKVNTGDQNCSSDIEVDVEYRRAYLTIYSRWATLIPRHREQSIVHELAHGLTEIQRRFARDLVLLLTEAKPDLKDYLREQLRKVNEATTEDLTLTLRRLGYLSQERL